MHYFVFMIILLANSIVISLYFDKKEKHATFVYL